VDTFPDGVWLVELAPLTDAGLVPQTVAAAIGIQAEPGQPPLASLVRALGSRQLLLLVDNCEHLIDASARLADALLRGCPGVRILATSREALGIAGEMSWRVPSLALPPLRSGPGDRDTRRRGEDDPSVAASESALAEVAGSEAVRLFVERAQLAGTGFIVTRQNAPVVAELCRRLDGIPLALELAAARLKGLSVEQLATRLDQRFRLLTGGSRAALPRQQTLTALVSWSYDLLGEVERALFNRLAVFSGGFTLEAAEEVCSSPKLAATTVEREDVLDLLLRLVEKSLVVAEPGERGEDRYRLLETLRQFARAKLVDRGEAETVHERHASFYFGLATGVEFGPFITPPLPHLAWLEREYDNVRAALQWLADTGQAERGMRLALALDWFWYTRGYLAEARENLKRLLESPAGSMPTTARAMALIQRGEVEGIQGEYAASIALLEDALAIGRQLGDQSVVMLANFVVAHTQYVRGDAAAARATIEQLLPLTRELGDPPKIAFTLLWLGKTSVALGDFASARQPLEEGLPLARLRHEELILANALEELAQVESGEGNVDRARPLFEEGLAIQRRMNNQRGIAGALVRFGDFLADHGDRAAAQAMHVEALGIYRAVGDRANVTESLESFAVLAARAGQAMRALRLAGSAAAKRETIESRVGPARGRWIDEVLQPIRQGLEESVAAAAWAEGQAMTLEEAVAYAIAEGGA
jgi:predicted ATPase